MIYDGPSVFTQSTPQRWQCLFSLLGERQDSVRCSPFKGVVGGRGEGPFHNFSLVHEAVGWWAVSAWWLLLSKNMSQFITWANISMDGHIRRNMIPLGLLFRCVLQFLFMLIVIESFQPLFFCLCQQGLQTSSNRDPPSHPCPPWLILASPTHACTTPGPFLTPPTPPAPASVASACQPPRDTTPTCHHLTQTTKPKTSSPTPTCITAQAPDPTSSPWWRQGTPGASAPLPACCPAQGPRAPEALTAWWTLAWTPRAKG